MTDHEPLDDLASAHLDGTTSPDEAAQVAADPALLARVEALRAVRAAVGAMPPVDPARRDAAITAAVTAFEEAGREEPSNGRARVTTLSEVRARRGPPARILRLVGAAAVVLLLAALVPLVANLGSSSDDADSAGDAAFEETGSSIGGDTDGASAPEATEDAATTGDQRTNTVALGDYDSLDELAAAVRGDRAPNYSLGLPDRAESASCASDGLLEPSAGGASIVGRRTASISGAPVLVIITSDADGDRVLRVYRVADCSLVGERRL